MMKSVARDYADFDSTDGKDKWEYYAPVGSFKPNGYSLFDISGNIWGWWGESEESGVLRSGSWDSYVNGLRVATPGFVVCQDFRIVGPLTPVRS